VPAVAIVEDGVPTPRFVDLPQFPSQAGKNVVGRSDYRIDHCGPRLARWRFGAEQA
jgi:hypothetical protein